MTPVRAQRFVMGLLLTIALILMHSGKTWGEYIIWFMIFMLFLHAFTGFCPSDIVFNKLFGKNKSDTEENCCK